MKEGLPVTKGPPKVLTKREKRSRDQMATSEDEMNNESNHIGEAQPAKEQRLMFNDQPNRILFAQNLPADIISDRLISLFQQVHGFKEVRIVPGNRGLAFIEFENEVQAGIALRQFNGFQLSPTHLLNLTYSN